MCLIIPQIELLNICTIMLSNRAMFCDEERAICIFAPLQWRHNGRDSVSNHQPLDCLLNCLFKAQIKENIKVPRHWPLWGELTCDRGFPAQRVSNAENVSIWWRHHDPGTLLLWWWRRVLGLWLGRLHYVFCHIASISGYLDSKTLIGMKNIA